MKNLISLVFAFSLSASAQIGVFSPGIFVPRAAGGGTAVTKVQQTTGTSGAGNTSLPLTAWGAATTAGHDIYCSFTYTSTTGNTTSITGITGGGTFSKITASAVSIAGTHYGDIYTEFWRATNIAGGTTTAPTATLANTTNGGAAGICYELTPGSTTVDVANVSSSASANVWSIGPFTPAHNGEYLMQAGIIDDGNGFGSGWWAAITPWVLDFQSGGGNEDSIAFSFAQATAASTTATATPNFPATVGPVVGTVVTVYK